MGGMLKHQHLFFVYRFFQEIRTATLSKQLEITDIEKCLQDAIKAVVVSLATSFTSSVSHSEIAVGMTNMAYDM